MPRKGRDRIDRRNVLRLAAAALVPALGTAAAKRPAHIALLMSDLRNPFFAAIVRAFQHRLQALSPGPVHLSIESAGFDHQRQVEHIEKALHAGSDILVVSPIDAELLQPTIRRAHRAGAKVIAVDSSVPEADLTITTDNFSAGRLACEHLIQRMGGRGNLAIIHGPANTADLDRVRGCKEVLARNKEIKVVSEMYNGGGTKEGGLERMVSILLSHPRLDGLFAINDPTALGAELAAREERRSEMVITCVDGSDEVSRRLRDSASLIVASAAQDPHAMGSLAAEGAARLLRGQGTDKPVVVLPPHLVTKENVQAYRGWSR